VVIHGTEAPLFLMRMVKLSHQPFQAHILSLKGMAHDLPLPLVPILTEKIVAHLKTETVMDMQVLSA